MNFKNLFNGEYGNLQRGGAVLFATLFMLVVSTFSALTSGMFFGEHFSPALTGLFPENLAFVVAFAIGAVAADIGAWAWFCALMFMSRNVTQYVAAGAMTLSCIGASIAASVLFILLSFPGLELGEILTDSIALASALVISGIVAAHFFSAFVFTVASPSMIDRLRDLEEYMNSETVRRAEERAMQADGLKRYKAMLAANRAADAEQYAAARHTPVVMAKDSTSHTNGTHPKG